MNRTLLALAVTGLFTFFSSAAGAALFTLDLDDCDADGCKGSELLLVVDDLGDSSDGAFTVTLTLDASSYTGNRDGIGQIGFKAFSSVDASNVTLTNAPGGAGAWDTTTESTINSDVSNGGCGSGSPSNHLCTDGFVDITGGGLFVWEWSVTNAVMLANVNDWHIGGQYCDGDPDAVDCRGQIISASGGGGGTVIPEPSAALVFAAALLAVAPRMRRR